MSLIEPLITATTSLYVAENLYLQYGDTAVNGAGSTLLHLFAQAGNEEIVRMLIRAGANIEKRDNSGQTPLFESVLFDSEGVCSLMIENGASCSATDFDGNTPLHCAACANAIRCTELLVEAGAEVNALNNNRMPPLFFAVSGRNRKTIAEYLLSRSANPLLLNCDNNNVLHFAVPSLDASTIEVLLAFGANPVQPNLSGDSPLSIAHSLEGEKAVEVQHLLEHWRHVQ